MPFQVAAPSNSLLLQQEAAADAYYGFPRGTMTALGTSETGNGVDLGSLGTIFQALPSTARDPGYGLSRLDGNDPFSMGGYLSALINGPAKGNVADGLALYQGRPKGSTGNDAMTKFLNDMGLSGLNGLLGRPMAGSPGSGSPAYTGGWQGYALQIGFGLLAVLLIGLGVAAIALKDSPGGVVKTVALTAGDAVL